MKTNKPKTTRIPLYRDTAFHLVDIPTMKQAFADEVEYNRDPELYIYSRYRNPNVAQAETMLMGIEESKWSVLTQSGLSAIDTALSIFQKKGSDQNWLFFSEIYGGTNQYIDSVLINRRGLNIFRFLPNGDVYSIEKFEELLKSTKPKVVFFEAISNPMLIALDGNAFIKKAKEYGASVIVDNTFATPYLWKPLENGADIVIHSVTKYLAGHGTLSAGVLSGNDKSIEKAALEYRKLVGHMLSPDDASRLCEQLRTYDLRVEKQFKNAFILAGFLNNHPMVEKVLYPGLETHPTHINAFKMFNGKGYGAIITFDIAGKSFEDKQRKCSKFIGLLQNDVPLIPTLGDTETTLMPIEPVWGDKFPYPGMIRLSVGVENIDKLTSTIKKALENLD